MQKSALKAFRENMIRKLEKKPWIAEHCMRILTNIKQFLILLTVIPDFPVACRRLTPGPGYLEALCEDNVRGLCFRECLS